MYLDQYQKQQISDFFGLYARGDINNTPSDHSSQFVNLATRGKKKEVAVRPGTIQSLNIGHNVIRIFETTQNTVLTCDGATHIYSTTTGGAPVTSLFLTVPTMIDFVAINLFNHTFILPICSAGGQVLYVWDGVAAAPRPALGAAPTSTFTVTQAAGGNITVGTHQFAVCFITTTGFNTQPGPKIAGVFTPVSVTFTAGNGTGNVTGLPIGPTGTTQRILLATKANLGVYYFIPSSKGGVINDNVTTTTTLNFLDTDLAIDASSLFNLRETISAAVTGYGGAGLSVYKGRMIVLDGTVQNQIPVSASGFPENFDSVVGFINVDYQQDQFISAFEYFSVLYVSGNTGLHATSDNGSDPSTWSVSLIDMGNGFPHFSLTNVLVNKYSGPLGSVVLGIQREGLYLFNGNVQRPCLSLNIQNVFDTFTHGAEHTPQLCVDLTKDIIYMLLPLNGSTTPNTLVVGDFSDGLSVDSIRWSTYTFPFTPQCIAIADFQDADDFDYWLRLGTNADVKKLADTKNTDSGTNIPITLQTNLSSFGGGTLDIFRFLRFRVKGHGNLNIQLQDQDGNVLSTPPAITLSPTPGFDSGRQINVTTEMMSMVLTYSNPNADLILNRIDVYGKIRWVWRPQ